MTKKLDNDSLLMITIFQQVLHVGDVERDPTKYLKRYDFDIKAAGQLFEYLGLAERDKAGPLGWKPTHRLMEIIARKAARPSKPSAKSTSGEDELILNLLSDAALGEYNDQRGYLGFHVLQALGLVKEDRGGDQKPTPVLQRLFADGYFRRQMESKS